jgi:hypothetical protein
MWVRQFTREVLRQNTRGVLDPARFGLPPRPPKAVRDSRFEAVCRVLYCVAWGVMIAIIACSVLLWNAP